MRAPPHCLCHPLALGLTYLNPHPPTPALIPQHPVHHVDPAWFAILGAALLCLVVAPMEVDEVMHSVEWDMLLFFAAQFVLVEAASEVRFARARAQMRCVKGRVWGGDSALRTVWSGTCCCL